MQPEQVVRIEQILSVVRRRAPAVLLCVVLVAGAAYIYSKHQRRLYTATASLLFTSSAANQQAAGLPVIGSSNQQSQQDTNVQLVQLGDLADETARKVGHGLTRQAVKRSLSVAPVGDTSVVTVSAVSASPTLATDIANTYGNQFVAEQQTSSQNYYAAALALVTRQLARLSPAQQRSTAGLDLQARAQSLGTLAELRTGTVQVAQAAAVPTSPSSPKIGRTTVLASILGVILGVVVSFLLERSDRLVRDPNEFATIYGLPLLGVVPESPELSRSIRRDAGSGRGLPAVEAETFHLIRAHMRYFNVDRELRTLLVASAAEGDGKTTVACHLAGAAARLGSRVLLVEADVRRPTISTQLQLHPGPGLTDVLIGAAAISDAIQTVVLDAPTGHAAERALDVLPAGATPPPNPAELLESHAMEALLEQTKEAYDLVVIDTPPLTVVSDAFPLLQKVDGVIVVGRIARDRRDVAQRTRETLESVGAPLLGIIANGVKIGGRGSYGYGYGYGYGYTRGQTGYAEPDGKEAPAAGKEVLPAGKEEAPPAVTPDPPSAAESRRKSVPVSRSKM